MLLRVLLLVLGAARAWPQQPIDRVIAASYAAARAERDEVSAELLLVIAEHESDLQPNAVSWLAIAGRRVDILWTRDRVPPENTALACGYGQTVVHSRSACAEVIAEQGGLAIAARELGEWLRSSLSAGNLRVALAGYAGGVAGARAAREGNDALAVRFSDLFLARARLLREAIAAPMRHGSGLRPAADTRAKRRDTTRGMQRTHPTAARLLTRPARSLLCELEQEASMRARG